MRAGETSAWRAGLVCDLREDAVEGAGEGDGLADVVEARGSRSLILWAPPRRGRSELCSGRQTSPPKSLGFPASGRVSLRRGSDND